MNICTDNNISAAKAPVAGELEPKKNKILSIEFTAMLLASFSVDIDL